MDKTKSQKTGAVVLAAGMSTRMGQPKMALPWGEGQTVIGQVVTTLAGAGVDPIVVVTGGAREIVTQALVNSPALVAFNPDFANGEMLASLRSGLKALPAGLEACLVALGDQPRIRLDTVRQVLAAGTEHPGRLVFPSYRMRRGHPWLIPAILIPEILALEAPQTMRDFSQAHAGEIVYVNVDTDTILQDLDTPEDYQQALNALQK